MRYSGLLSQLQRLTVDQLDMDVCIADDTGEVFRACYFVIPQDIPSMSVVEKENMLVDEILGSILDDDHPYIRHFET